MGDSVIAYYLRCVGNWQANTQVIDCQLQKEGAECLGGGLLNAWQLIHHFFCGHVNVLVEGHTLLIPVVICSFVV